MKNIAETPQKIKPLLLINQEKRMRVLEEYTKENKENFKRINTKINTQFLIILCIFLTTLITKLFT